MERNCRELICGAPATGQNRNRIEIFHPMYNNYAIQNRQAPTHLLTPNEVKSKIRQIKMHIKRYV